MAKVKPVIMQPGTGEELRAFGNILHVLLNSEQTGGTIAVMLETTPPGGGPPTHFHNNEDEIFLVIDGQISYFAEGQWTEVGVGGVVYLPTGVIHSYRNIGSSPSRHWIITIPAGFEKFFARCAEEFAKAGGPDMDRINTISHEQGIIFVGDGPKG